MDECKQKVRQRSILPYSAAYIHRLNRIIKQRQELEKIKATDVCSTRSSGSLRTFTGDVAKLHISEKEFGIPSRVAKADEVPRFCFSNIDVMRICESANRSKTTSQRARSSDKSKKRLSVHGNLESVSMYVIDSETSINMSKALKSAEKKIIERNSTIAPWISCINGTRSKHRVVNIKIFDKEKFDIAIRSAPSYKLGKWIRKSPSKSAPSSPSNDNNMNFIPFITTQTNEISTYFDPVLLKSPIKLSTTGNDYTPDKLETINKNEDTNIEATSEINKLYVSIVASKSTPLVANEAKPEAICESAAIEDAQLSNRHVRWLSINLYSIPSSTSLLSDCVQRDGHYEVALTSVISVGAILDAVTGRQNNIPRDSIKAIMVDNVVYNIPLNTVITSEVHIYDTSAINVYCIDDSGSSISAAITDSVVDAASAAKDKKQRKKKKKDKK